ncbi:unnamed protein product [Fraxinus pennsylvanica]|uniref:Uncharacterized protein n=1 Tax=Fraxinus pennsylvanica TaxID=56036 RepID=A0AAD1YLB5_9LAMI|nr:unnamed protein product [Fraxinus pennsylvanica]
MVVLFYVIIKKERANNEVQIFFEGCLQLLLRNAWERKTHYPRQLTRALFFGNTPPDQVQDKGVWFTSYIDVPKYRRSVLTSGMFPSGKTYDETSEQDHETVTTELVENGKEASTGNGLQLIDYPIVPTQSSEAEVSALPLERCMRIVPHDQNTGLSWSLRKPRCMCSLSIM